MSISEGVVQYAKDGETASHPDRVTIFLCKTCQRLVGDSLACVRSDKELDIISVNAAYDAIEILPGIKFSSEGRDAGSAYSNFQCRNCKSELGRIYKASSSELIDPLRNLISFSKSALILQQTGSYSVFPTVRGIEVPSKPEMLLESEKLADHEEQLIQVKAVLLAHNEHLYRLEQFKDRLASSVLSLWQSAKNEAIEAGNGSTPLAIMNSIVSEAVMPAQPLKLSEQKPLECKVEEVPCSEGPEPARARTMAAGSESHASKPSNFKIQMTVKGAVPEEPHELKKKLFADPSRRAQEAAVPVPAPEPPSLLKSTNGLLFGNPDWSKTQKLAAVSSDAMAETSRGKPANRNPWTPSAQGLSPGISKGEHEINSVNVSAKRSFHALQEMSRVSSPPSLNVTTCNATEAHESEGNPAGDPRRQPSLNPQVPQGKAMANPKAWGRSSKREDEQEDKEDRRFSLRRRRKSRR